MENNRNKSNIKKQVNEHLSEVPHSGELSSNNRPNEYDLVNMERKGHVEHTVPGAHKKVR